MTAKAALCQLLLDGATVNIKNCFVNTGLTNAPREISRMVEKPFGIIVSRYRRTGKSRFGQHITWFDYYLNPRISSNKKGIKKMKKYISEQRKKTKKC